MKRRTLLAAPLAAVAAAALAAPRLARAQGSRVLKFIPQADLTLLDPMATGGFVTRNHAMMVYDTLYGIDSSFTARPQMAAGHVVENDGKQWTITLRPGLRFHDGEPVRAADAVASLRRWAARDSYGQALMAATDELAAPTDTTIRFRLKRPFPIDAALGKLGGFPAFVMPERLIPAEAAKPVTEIIGSGPYRYLQADRVQGARNAYARFEAYIPRDQGIADVMAGPKLAHFDRVEWHTIPDAATAAAALQAGEMDWWEQPTPDLLPLLRRHAAVNVQVLDTVGFYALIRLNQTQPPFNNPAFRRAILGAIDQSDFMTAAAGTDRTLWRDDIGFFLPGGTMASDAGMAALTAPRNLDAARRAIAASGYAGEKLALIAPTDFPSLNAMSEITGDLLRKLGVNLDYQATDWGSTLKRIQSQEPVEKGGWSALCTFTAGINALNPASHHFLRGAGKTGIWGWPESPDLEAMRNEWLQGVDGPAEQSLARRMQEAAFRDVPYIPTGIFFQATAHRRNLVDLPKMFAQFYGVRRI
jgi:peptide/nickel transport system substrate-binding protein